MNTLFKIIDLAERLSDRDLRISVNIHHGLGPQMIDVFIQRDNSMMHFSTFHFTPDEILGYLELIEFHGFRQEHAA